MKILPSARADKAQASFEVISTIALIAAALATAVPLLKTHVMGGWFNSAQQLGDPYNAAPGGTTGEITHSLTSFTHTYVESKAQSKYGVDSLYTIRLDQGGSFEGKLGELTVKP